MHWKTAARNLTALAIPLTIVAALTHLLAPLSGGLVCNGNCPRIHGLENIVTLAVIATVTAVFAAYLIAHLVTATNAIKEDPEA